MLICLDTFGTGNTTEFLIYDTKDKTEERVGIDAILQALHVLGLNRIEGITLGDTDRLTWNTDKKFSVISCSNDFIVFGITDKSVSGSDKSMTYAVSPLSLGHLHLSTIPSVDWIDDVEVENISGKLYSSSTISVFTLKETLHIKSKDCLLGYAYCIFLMNLKNNGDIITDIIWAKTVKSSIGVKYKVEVKPLKDSDKKCVTINIFSPERLSFEYVGR